MFKYAFILAMLFLFLCCNKKQDSITLTYTIKRVKGINSYSVAYKKNDGSDVLIGPLNQQNWNSGLLEGFKPGDKASVTLKTSGSNEDYNVKIIVNGNVLKEEEFISANSTQTLEANIY